MREALKSPRTRLVLLAILGATAIVAGALVYRSRSPRGPAMLDHGRFESLRIYEPRGQTRGVVLLPSGARGWGEANDALARALARAGAMVVGIDLAQLEANLEADGGDCVFPDGDLENLSHFVQAYYRLPGYAAPILIGEGEGAAFAYAMLAQAPPNTFAGAVGVDFRPVLGLRKPLCRGSGVEFRARADGRGVDLLPALELHGRWIVVPPTADPAPVVAAYARIAADAAPRVPPAPGALADLPLTELPAPRGGASDAFAIVLSGDGGWAGLDKDVAAALVAAGIPVVGWDSLRYFWGARTPQGLANDLDRTIRYYLAHFAKKRVLLVGYSQGADALPFAVNRLPPTTRSAVALTALMGLSMHAVFEFHLSNWLSDDDSGLPTVPETLRIGTSQVLCIYGANEDDSACPKLDTARVRIVKMPGGHHFGGDYAGLARHILEALPR